MSKMLKAALRYLELGFHPIPCPPREKRPSVPWKDYQTTAPTDAQVREWWTKTPDANLALVLGRGVFAVDLDGGDDAEALLREAGVELPADAPRSKTGGGYHVLLSAHQPVGDRVALLSANGGKPQVDIRGVGIIVAPPSIHPSGATYQWLVKPEPGKRPPGAPQALLGLLAQAGTTAPPNGQPKVQGAANEAGWVARALHGVGEGQRNATCAKLAGYFLGRQMDAETVTTLLSTGFGPRCIPPLPDKEVAATVKSIAARATVAGDDIDVRPEHISVVLKRFMHEMEHGGPKPMATPFAELNNCLDGGFVGGQLIYIGARPGVGKTAMALELARMTVRAGSTVLIVSREMTNSSLARRLLAQDARVRSSSLKRGDLTDVDWANFGASVDRLSQTPLWLTDKMVSLEQLNTYLATAHADLVIVDYLQLMRAPREIKERRHQVEHVSHGLKTLALAHQVPVICLSSLSRPATKDPTNEPRPTMASLRESGELEHDADVILLLHRQRDDTSALCIVEKNRDGRLGTVKLIFHGPFVAFTEDPDQTGA